MNLTKLMRTILVGLPVLALAACATTHTPPSELVDARAAYAHAAQGTAPTLVPAQLHVAREALDRAELEYSKQPGSQDARDTAYIALRTAQRAEALGNAAADTAAQAAAEAERAKTQDDIIESQQGELTQEKQARIAAESNARDAMEALSKRVAVKAEPRGTVITVPTEVMFATGQSAILPGAQMQLDQIAEALEAQGEHRFTVEGHTDDQGTDPVNDELSRSRAIAVRDYLIARGVPEDAIIAEGYGSTRPIADNRTPEGRALNRRVEIVVDRGAPTSASR